MNPYDRLNDLLLGLMGAYILGVEYGLLPTKKKHKPWVVMKIAGAILLLNGLGSLLRLW